MGKSRKRRGKQKGQMASLSPAQVTQMFAASRRSALRLLSLPTLTPVQLPMMSRGILATVGLAQGEIRAHWNERESVWGPISYGDDQTNLERFLAGEDNPWGDGTPDLEDEGEQKERTTAVIVLTRTGFTYDALAAGEFYVTDPEMTALTLAGSDPPAEVAVTVADLPSPSGFAFLPLDDTDGLFILWSVKHNRMLHVQVATKSGMDAFLSQDNAFGWKVGSQRYLYFQAATCALSAPDSDAPPETAKLRIRDSYVAADEHDHPAARALYPEGLDSEQMLNLLLSFANMVRQEKLVERTTQREAEHHKIGPRGKPHRREVTVNYVGYRPGRNAPTSSMSDSKRAYTHRWTVRGHWRRQWYASQQRHLPVWITEHIAGPSDAPLRVRQRVTKIRAHEA